MMQKLTSRKFWMAVAAALASLAGSIAGFATQNDALAVVGFVCMAASAAIYAACEAYVDGKSATANSTNTTVSVSTSNKEVVEKVLGTDGQ